MHLSLFVYASPYVAASVCNITLHNYLRCYGHTHAHTSTLTCLTAAIWSSDNVASLAATAAL